ncbi:contractile injection system protein, VgrG/Pvc8 family [Hydrogenophaga sp. UC242_50]|uniref:contractile injection system protein, VgrG/Pvc8 family n=1 Tax=unclassified Hydrogenophaga TaxID=2610897 RepID=UPI0036D30800
MTPSTPRRGLTIRSAAIPEVNGVPLLEPLKLEGEEGLNTLFEYRLVLQSAEGGGGNHLDLNRFIGRELTCCLELEGQGSFVPGVPGGAGANQGAGVREISGLITEARYIGESGRHALVEFTLRPWLHLATLSTDCKVFQDQSPVEIIEAVLGEYPFAADKRLIERYPRRDYTVQYNESDYEFVSRLMQEWGINHHFEHSGGVHRLIWSDHNGAFQAVQPGLEPGASAPPAAPAQRSRPRGHHHLARATGLRVRPGLVHRAGPSAPRGEASSPCAPGAGRLLQGGPLAHGGHGRAAHHHAVPGQAQNRHAGAHPRGGPGAATAARFHQRQRLCAVQAGAAELGAGGEPGYRAGQGLPAPVSTPLVQRPHRHGASLHQRQRTGAPPCLRLIPRPFSRSPSLADAG